MKRFIYTLSNIIKKIDYYLVKSEYHLVFNDYHFCPYVASVLSDNKAMIFWSSFLEKSLVISKIKDKLSIV